MALVAANSTKNVPEVFVAKVLRLSEDKKTAYLADFAEEGAVRFKSKAGKSYKENTSSLIFPIDIVFSHWDGLYELRTPKIDLHLKCPRFTVFAAVIENRVSTNVYSDVC